MYPPFENSTTCIAITYTVVYLCLLYIICRPSQASRQAWVSRPKLERIYKVDAMLLGAQISVKKLLETDEKGIFKLTNLHEQVRF